MEFAPIGRCAVGARNHTERTLGAQIPKGDGRSLHSYLPHPQTQAGHSEGAACAEDHSHTQKKSAEGKLTLAFVDECGFSPSQPVNYSWTPAGQRKYVPYENPQRRRINVMTAMIADSQTGSLVWTKLARSFTSDDFMRFLRETLPRGPRMTVVVMDNYSIHRSRVVREARRGLRRAGLALYYLPPYSPELNDIEGVFGAIKHHDMPERSYGSLDELGEAIDGAFDRAEQRLKSRYEYLLSPTA